MIPVFAAIKRFDTPYRLLDLHHHSVNYSALITLFSITLGPLLKKSNFNLSLMCNCNCPLLVTYVQCGVLGW